MDMTYDPCLESEMKASKTVIEYLANRDIAVDFYQGLCNTQWKKENLSNPQDEVIMSRLRGEELGLWSCSWRYAAGIISDIRNANYATGESYLDFYCSGSEGLITPEVKKCFNDLGWVESPYKEDL
jgi:hypothetical protein